MEANAKQSQGNNKIADFCSHVCGRNAGGSVSLEVNDYLHHIFVVPRIGLPVSGSRCVATCRLQFGL